MKKRYILTAYFTAAVLSGLGLAVWRMLLILRYYDPYLGEYALEANGSLKILGYVTCAVIILLASAAVILRKTEFSPIVASSSQTAVFASSFAGFMFFAVAIMLLIYHRESIFAESAHAFFKILQTLSLFTMFFASAYFLLNSSAEPNGTKMKTALSFFPTIWTLLYLITSYANPEFIYNDPDRLFCNVSLIAILLFCLYETRRNAVTPLNHVHFTFGVIAIVCALVYIVPTFLLTAFWEIELTVTTFFEATELGILFYIAALLYVMIKSVKTADQPLASELAEAIPTEE